MHFYTIIYIVGVPFYAVLMLLFTNKFAFCAYVHEFLCIAIMI